MLQIFDLKEIDRLDPEAMSSTHLTKAKKESMVKGWLSQSVSIYLYL